MAIGPVPCSISSYGAPEVMPGATHPASGVPIWSGSRSQIIWKLTPVVFTKVTAYDRLQFNVQHIFEESYNFINMLRIQGYYN